MKLFNRNQNTENQEKVDDIRTAEELAEDETVFTLSKVEENSIKENSNAITSVDETQDYSNETLKEATTSQVEEIRKEAPSSDDILSLLSQNELKAEGEHKFAAVDFTEMQNNKKDLQIEKQAIVDNISLKHFVSIENKENEEKVEFAQIQIQQAPQEKVVNEIIEIVENQTTPVSQTEQTEETSIKKEADLEKVKQYAEQIKQYDTNKQVKLFTELQARRDKVNQDIVKFKFQKEQVEKEIEKIEKEILETTGLDNVEDYAEFLLKKVQENDSIIEKFLNEIKEKEEIVKKIKQDLSEVE